MAGPVASIGDRTKYKSLRASRSPMDKTSVVDRFRRSFFTDSQSNKPMTNDTKKNLESVVKHEMEAIFDHVPMARKFHAGEWTDVEYYKRHIAETVLRIRLNIEVDAYALYKIGSRDNQLAAILAKYLAEEYGHEGLFMRDLTRFSLNESALNEMQPFLSTEKLIGYLYHSINRDGPLPTMIWNWFVEFYSDLYNKRITQKAASVFGDDKVKGTMGHIEYDESHNHDDLMWSAVERAIEGWGNEKKAESYVRNFVRLIGEYFDELHQATVGQSQAVEA
jgi:hypothetical protein